MTILMGGMKYLQQKLKLPWTQVDLGYVTIFHKNYKEIMSFLFRTLWPAIVEGLCDSSNTFYSVL